MLEKLEPEKRIRSVPAHLVGYFVNGIPLENAFDETLARAVEAAFEPGRIADAFDLVHFCGRLKLAGVDYEGDCVRVVVLERY
jgi:hypothetical protein